MIRIELTNNPGYPTRNPVYLGTVHHSTNGVAASVNSDYKSTWPVRRYMCGIELPNFPAPATCEPHMSPELMDHWSSFHG